MKLLVYLYNLANGHICIAPNYGQSIHNKKTYPCELISELKSLLKSYGSESKFMLMIDLTKINMSCEHASSNLPFYISLQKAIVAALPDKLEKIIIYDYTEKTAFLLNIAKIVLDREIRNKIILDKNYKIYVEKFMEHKINLNNNELHC